MTYEQIKNWARDNKQKFVLAACFALVFIVGFGTGRFNEENENKLDGFCNNYTMNAVNKPENKDNGKTQEPITSVATQTVAPQILGQGIQSDCPVKGNISSKGSKIYHVQGGAFYNITKPEQCFQTEAEAQAAGFKRSSR